MKHLRLLYFFSIIGLLTACGGDDDDDDNDEPTAPQTIAEIAAGNADFSTLVSALDRTNLTATLNGSGTYTVFAPTNAAFDALGVDLSTLSDDDLTEILLYHVLGNTVASSDIASGQTYVSTLATTGPGNSALSLLVEGGSGVSLNGNSDVTTADLEASNGVIHVIDAVLLPLDVVGHASANSNFTSLVGALGTADGDLVTTLQGDGPFTVFAPLNSAFDAVSSVTATLSTAELANVLTYHVVSPANVLSTTLTDGQVVEALNGESFTVNVGSSVTLTDNAANDVGIVIVDVQATNGVIHVLDAVLLP